MIRLWKSKLRSADFSPLYYVQTEVCTPRRNNGVLGPMRMSYARTIPTVRYVADLLSDLVNDTLVEE